MINDFLRTRIKLKFATEKETDPTYSLRTHAQSLGLSPGAYSDFISGRRRFSDKKAFEITMKLSLDESEQKLLTLLMSPRRQIISDKTFSLIKEWHHFAILAVLEIDHPPQNVEQIASALGLSLTAAKASIEKLIEQKLLLRDSNGALSLTGLSYVTTDDIPSDVIRGAHKEGLSLAAKAIDQISTDQRDFTSLTFSGSSNQISRAKKEIRKCMDRVSQIMAAPEKDQVYRLSIQLFPIVKTKGKS